MIAAAPVRSELQNALSKQGWHLLLFVTTITWQLLSLMKLGLQRIPQKILMASKKSGLADGKTVLVTTGRMAKSLHIVRALKEAGARVVVGDYSGISASAASVACDAFVQLPPLNRDVRDWVADFEVLLRAYAIDVVIPSSTINEALFVAAARDALSNDMPHIRWLCADASTTLALDDRAAFAKLCALHDIPAPAGGVCTSLADIPSSASFPHGIILKRIESSVNRAEEIVPVPPGSVTASCVTPSPSDPWQWQQFLRGEEFSAWYLCVDGVVTFSSCYRSEADLVAFDVASVPHVLDEALRGFIKALDLSGQFAFDFFIEENTGRAVVIECNPRSSSVLETVSETPGWGDAFLGVDVSDRVVVSNTGFLFHGNCWPFAHRREGFFKWWDPLPFIVAEILYPVKLIADCSLEGRGYKHVDVNIGKIIKTGPSPKRNLDKFKEYIHENKAYSEINP